METKLKECKKDITLKISKKIKYKIDCMCRMNWNREWSGVLFYKVKGSWKDNNLKLTVVDFNVMDIGSSGFTEFEESPEIISYIAENNLFDCFMGLIHSHNTMAK